MRTKKSLVLFVCLFLILTLAAACTQMRTPRQDQQQGRQTDENVPRTTRQIIPRTPVTPSAPDGTPTKTDNRQYTERARRIANKVADIDDIESAACVITGNTAMIGVQFNEQYKGKMTDAIKKKIDQVVKQADTRIDRVAVTTDPDVVSRIRDIFRDIGQGKPVSGFAKEINELLNRIQPK